MCECDGKQDYTEEKWIYMLENMIINNAQILKDLSLAHDANSKCEQML